MIDKFIPGKSVLIKRQAIDPDWGVIDQVPDYLVDDIVEWEKVRLLTNETYESAVIVRERLTILYEREMALRKEMEQIEQERRKLNRAMYEIWNELPPAKPAYIKE